ncbi:MAG: response regulator transcription factor [Bacilli bacterium]|jgi:DNA-binding response OmpR family regulator|nr:response regulator transcription factor [Bacilli bacterium]
MQKILIIDDENSITMTLKYDLEMFNYKVETCSDGLDGLNLIKNNYYDLAIIDITLPSLDGIEIIKRVRTFNEKIKLIVLSASDDEMDIINGLDIGANDYVTKPFLPRILYARIRSLLKDSKSEDANVIFNIKDNIVLDHSRRAVMIDNEEISLTKLEYDLLYFLLTHKNTVVSREDIMNNVWGYKYDGNNRIIDIYIHKLKDKLSLDNEIVNKRGIGYILYL